MATGINSQFTWSGAYALPAELFGSQICPFLYSAALRYLARVCPAFCLALRHAPEEIRRRGNNLVCWSEFGGGSQVELCDAAVALGGGTWHPGGVAVADLPLRDRSSISFRFVLERPCASGDLLLGITRCFEDSSQIALQAALDTGYCFIMGRELAPASIFFGGRSLRCCYSIGNGEGPRIDYGPRPRILRGGRLMKLRALGDWVEFQVLDGMVQAHDNSGYTFQWGARLSEGELWKPTVAWTGSRVAIRISI